jgi:hypothetical protein
MSRNSHHGETAPWAGGTLSTLLCAVMVLGTSCSNDSKLALWDGCETNSDCQTGVCEFVWAVTGYPVCDSYPCSKYRCTIDCNEAPCPDGASCGTAANGRRVCMEDCITGGIDGQAGCVNGAFVACEHLLQMDQYCGDCGCHGTGQVCRLRYEDPQGSTPPFCGTPAQVGEDCDADEECASTQCMFCYSDPCDFQNFTCGVAFGDQCTSQNCEICINTGTSTFCTKECSSDPECPGGWRCAWRRYVSDPDYYCWIECTPGETVCPAGLTCQGVADEWGSIQYHACI